MTAVLGYVLLALGNYFLGWMVGRAYGKRSTLTRYNHAANRGDFEVEYDTHGGIESIRCANAKALPKAWRIK